MIELKISLLIKKIYVMKNKWGLCLFLAIFMFANSIKAQLVSVKTNALHWATMAPNLGFEIVLGERSTVNFHATGWYKTYGMNIKGWLIAPEYRFWLSGRPLTREYIGLSVLAINYTDKAGIFSEGNCSIGDALGAGITGGYVFNLSERWNLELSAGAGVVAVRSKQYKKGTTMPEHADPIKYKVIPINLGVTFSYIIK